MSLDKTVLTALPFLKFAPAEVRQALQEALDALGESNPPLLNTPVSRAVSALGMYLNDRRVGDTPLGQQLLRLPGAAWTAEDDRLQRRNDQIIDEALTLLPAGNGLVDRVTKLRTTNIALHTERDSLLQQLRDTITKLNAEQDVRQKEHNDLLQPGWLGDIHARFERIEDEAATLEARVQELEGKEAQAVADEKAFLAPARWTGPPAPEAPRIPQWKLDRRAREEAGEVRVGVSGLSWAPSTTQAPAPVSPPPLRRMTCAEFYRRHECSTPDDLVLDDTRYVLQGKVRSVSFMGKTGTMVLTDGAQDVPVRMRLGEPDGRGGVGEDAYRYFMSMEPTDINYLMEVKGVASKRNGLVLVAESATALASARRTGLSKSTCHCGVEGCPTGPDCFGGSDFPEG